MVVFRELLDIVDAEIRYSTSTGQADLFQIASQ